MAEIFVKVARLGSRVTEVYLPDSGEATVAAALAAAEVDPGGYDLRVNGAPTTPSAVLADGDVVTLVPPIKGGV